MLEPIQGILGQSNIHFYWKGRVALYALLKAMGIKEGDEVILPGFTCVVVPNAILYLGSKPVYVDIIKESYCPSFEEIKNKISPKTRVIICQNTFGLSYQVNEITALARENGIWTIEDCCHGFGGTYEGQSNGTGCDAAFYSTQWNKPFSTGVGGFAVVNNELLTEPLQEVNQELLTPSTKDRMILSLLLYARKSLLTPGNYWRMVRLYRWLSKHNLVIGSSAPEELAGTSIPSNYFKEMSSVQYREGKRAIQELPSQLKKRKDNATIYTQFLKQKKKNHVKEHLFNNHSFLRYPLLVKNREEFLHRAEAAKLYIGDWFCSPLHPIMSGLEYWLLNREEIPMADDVSKKIVNLPTDVEQVEEVIDFLHRNIDMIE